MALILLRQESGGGGGSLLVRDPAAGVRTDAALGVGSEIDQFEGSGLKKAFASRFEGDAKAVSGAEKGMVNLAEFESLRLVEAGASKTDHVQARDAIVATGDAEGWEILADARAALHEGEPANATELMHDAIA